MTTPRTTARSHHWLRAVGYGLLAEITTIVTIIVIVMLHRYVFAVGRTTAEYDAFAARTGAVVGIVGGTLYTFAFARTLMRRVAGRHIAHGIVVAIAAIALSVGGSLAGHRGVPSGYLIASALKLAAGAIAGMFAAAREARAVG